MYFKNLLASSYLALKLGYYKQNTYTQSGAENSLFQFRLTFSPFSLEEMKNYYAPVNVNHGPPTPGT